MDIGTPNCDALYQVVKVETEPGTVFQEVPCRHRKAHKLPALMHSLGGLWTQAALGVLLVFKHEVAFATDKRLTTRTRGGSRSKIAAKRAGYSTVGAVQI